MRTVIQEYLSHFDLDVRKSGDARFSDQKCTPDVVCFIADCIMNTVQNIDFFSVDTIWQSQYFIQNTRAIFNKPWANDIRAKHEYDKFIQQPLRLLAYAHILEIERKGVMNVYRDRFIRFMIGNTKINGAVEIRRIFPKILNVFAAEYQIYGSERGHISKNITSFSDLMYNRKNWRDMNKEKSISRQEATADSTDTIRQEAYNAYYVQKAIARIKKIHSESEVHDQWSNGDATQVHHIFPKTRYPEIAHYLENLILLTATQHFTQAHPNNKTQEVNEDYQLVCLLAKADTIDKSLQKYGERYYRKESFLYVLNVGLAKSFEMNLSFDDIKTQLIRIYNAY